jgi:hypothetical protein
MTQPSYHDRGPVLSSTTWWEQYNETLSESATHRVVAYVRSFAPAPGHHGNRALVLDELQSAVGSGTLDSSGLTVLGEGICRCQNCQRSPEASRLLETAETLSRWTSEGLRSTGFEERLVCSEITDEEYRVIVPPELAVGIYADDRLVGVFPSATETDLFKPIDYAATLVSHRTNQAEKVTELP